MTLLSAGITTGDSGGGGGFDLNTDGLISRWTFNYPAQSGLIDSHGSTPGTINGMTYTDQSAEGGTAGSFDGTDDYVTFDNSIQPTNFTYSLWVKTTNAVAYALHQEQLGPWNRVAILNSSNGGVARFTLTAGSTVDLDGTSSVIDGAWHHIGCTFDGSTMRLFVDGTEENSVANSGTAGYTSEDVLEIGRNPGNGTYYAFDADDYRIYNRALSASEISAIAAGDA